MPNRLNGALSSPVFLIDFVGEMRQAWGEEGVISAWIFDVLYDLDMGGYCTDRRI
jgi:hypothetical protein